MHSYILKYTKFLPEALGKEPFLDVLSGKNFLSLLPQHGTIIL